MSDDRITRRAAAALLMRSIRSAEHRELLASFGHTSGEPILVVLDTDTVGKVIGRILDESPTPPAIVAMYRAHEGKLVVWCFHPGPAHSAETVLAVGHGATIGMLYDTMASNGVREMDLAFSVLGRSATRLRAGDLLVGA